MRRVFAIRPEPGFSATVRAGRAAGLEIGGEPLFVIEPVSWKAPDPAQYDGLLFGSANAVRHGGPDIGLYLDLPVYAVGRATAEMARKTGFPVARVGEGGLQSVLDTLSPPLRLLRLAGEDHVALDMLANIVIDTCVVYRSLAREISEEFAASLSHDGIILLHSAVAAEHLAREIERYGIDRSRLSIAAIGPRIVDAVGTGWATVRSAESPRESALLALARQMCE